MRGRLGRHPFAPTGRNRAANDVRSFDRARFLADVDELTAALPLGTYIADVPDFMHGRWGERAAEAGGILAARAGARQLHIVRLHDTQRDLGAGAMLIDFAADWFHPNDRGHRVWADAFWNVLRHESALTAALSGLQRTFMESTPGIVAGIVDSGDDIDLHPVGRSPTNHRGGESPCRART